MPPTRSRNIGMWFLLLILALSLTACNAGADAPPTPTRGPDYTDPASQVTPGSITANGVLRPAQQVRLSFGVAGFIESVSVRIGETVQAGQTLSRLETTGLEQAIARSELGLHEAHVGLNQSQLRLQQLQRPPDEADTRQAEHAVDQAAAALRAAQLDFRAVLNSTLLNETLEDARKVVEEMQHRYDVRLGWYESGEEPDYWFVDNAQENLDNARLSLARIEQPGNAQLQDVRNAVEQAEHSYQEAQDGLERLLEEADPLDVKVVQKEIEAAELEVEAAELTLETARTDLAQAIMEAPFDGAVSDVPVSVGEWATPGAAVIELLDVSRWRIETKNVGELEIAHVQVGQEVVVRVNAFRDEPLAGRVVTISPVAVVQQGDTTYTLMIELEPTDLNLRPGMTTQVEIVTE